MKSAFAVIVVLSLVASPVSAVAQSREADPSGSATSSATWAKARDAMRPGAAVTILRKHGDGRPPGQLYVVDSDDAGLTVVNLRPPTLSVATRETLRDAAEHHPDFFAAAERGTQVTLKKRVRLGPGGIFEGDQKVAELIEVVERVDREEIGGIVRSKSAGSAVGCGVLAYVVGGIPGGFAGGLLVALVTPHSKTNLPPAFGAGILAGMIAGTTFVYHKCWKTGKEVIYGAM
jgi:hypothetical protein